MLTQSYIYMGSNIEISQCWKNSQFDSAQKLFCIEGTNNKIGEISRLCESSLVLLELSPRQQKLKHCDFGEKSMIFFLSVLV